MSGFQTDLLVGLAARLHANSVGTWSTTSAYTSSQTGIVLGDLPQSPDRIIALAAYPVSDDAALSDSVIGVQIRCRWGGKDASKVDDLADLVFNLLHGATHVVLSTGVVLVQCLRQSGATLGQDGNGRWGNVQNFYCSVHRPSTNRT